MTDKENELLNVLENLARHHLHTNRTDGGKTTGCFDAESAALETLAANGRFTITKKYGRTRTGYWPENRPIDVDNPKQGER